MLSAVNAGPVVCHGTASRLVSVVAPRNADSGDACTKSV